MSHPGDTAGLESLTRALRGEAETTTATLRTDEVPGLVGQDSAGENSDSSLVRPLGDFPTSGFENHADVGVFQDRYDVTSCGSTPVPGSEDLDVLHLLRGVLPRAPLVDGHHGALDRRKQALLLRSLTG